MASQSSDTIECVENKEILNLVGEHKGKLNFHDALIALVSKEMEIEYIVSFDRDFDEIGWLKRVEYEG